MSQFNPIGTILPEQYGLWELESHDIEVDDDNEVVRGVISYELRNDVVGQYSVFIEYDGGEWDGALMDIGNIESNPHREPLEKFYEESVEDVLDRAREYMDEFNEEYRIQSDGLS